MGPNVSTAAATAVSGAASPPSPFSSRRRDGTRAGQVRAEHGDRGGDDADVDRAHHNQREPCGPSEVAPGFRNSPARCETASQPAKQKNSRLAAPPTAQ